MFTLFREVQFNILEHTGAEGQRETHFLAGAMKRNGKTEGTITQSYSG